ncbi:MAG: tripartite tricarboxylate transporter substrate binding protein [Rhodospirillaceae bacterium]|jgi:tripartite-type tricarboxylate transporter receptor subunit TctC|nr:tripartite tricarboxylate transporter substrate binding protein [Rhodospirillaceae bacterium]MBT7267917.1 tripartite tricarboxylate transporter substrate binding protein [Rhodospirillaceae bacterium]
MRRFGLHVLTLALAIVISISMQPSDSKAAEYPNKPIKLVVPWKVGGGTDRTARIFAPYLSKALGVPVNIINIAGGGGWVAWAQMANWDPKKDDHVIGFVNFPHMLSYLNPKMKNKNNLKSFNFLTGHSMDPCIWAVREGDPRFSTLPQFIKYVVDHPNKIKVSVGGFGSDDHQAVAFAEKFIPGFKVKKIFGNNDAKKLQELYGETADAVGGNISYFVPHMVEGKLRTLAVLGKERSNWLPNTPTFAESSGVKNFNFAIRVLTAAPGLDSAKKKILIDGIHKAMDMPEYAMRELKNSNTLWKVQGDDLDAFLNDLAGTVKKVAFWDTAK